MIITRWQHRLDYFKVHKRFNMSPKFACFLQVISWLSYEGKDILAKHDSIAENLKGITSQQKQLEKQYFNAMVIQFNLNLFMFN